jgi:hypothetical protein
VTSQIVLMNQLSIAVASDTLTSRNEESGETKTYPSMSKIFALGAPHQIAVLHCGCTNLGDAHWRMLVTEWSRSLEAPFAKVSDYTNNFMEWLAKHAEQLGLRDDNSFGQIFATQFMRFKTENQIAIDQALGRNGHHKSKDFAKELIALLENFQSERCTEDPYQDLTDESAAEALQSSGVDAVEGFRWVLGVEKDCEFPPELAHAITGFAIELVKRYVDSSETINLTFVGYGTDEYFGQVCSRFFTGFYAGKMRFKPMDGGSTSPGDYPFAIPLAQNRAIFPFLHGADGALLGRVADSFGHTATTDLKLESEKVKQLIDTAMKSIDGWLNAEFSSPMFRTLDALGPSALSRYADLLIRMESLRSATLKDEATVGGIVESLSISRSSGVEWHYRIGHDFQPIEASSHILA